MTWSTSSNSHMCIPLRVHAYICSYFQCWGLTAMALSYPITWLAYVKFQGTSRVEKLLHQGLGQHGGGEQHRAPALAVDGSHQAVGDQAELLINLTLGIQIWAKNKTFILWAPLQQYWEKEGDTHEPEMTGLVILVLLPLLLGLSLLYSQHYDVQPNTE